MKRKTPGGLNIYNRQDKVDIDKPNRFHRAVPILNVTNFAASVDYYIYKLGFEKRWDWGDPPTFGCVSRGDLSIFLCEGAQGQPGTWMWIAVQDVDALYENYKKTGAIVVEPPANYPWGSREMLVGDPDGHRLRMASDATGPADDAQLTSKSADPD